MEIRILASGSKGNIISIVTENHHFLVDVGISYLQTRKKLKSYGLTVESVEAIILTHEHSDHTKGLRVFLKNNPGTKIYLTRGTMEGLDEETKEFVTNYEFIKADTEFSLLGVNIMPLETSHDAKESVGLVIRKGDKKAVFISDTGYIPRAYFEIISDADFYYLEANHDEVMLIESRKRPFHLKQRILSERGHLSNNDATIILNEIIKTKRPVWAVAHISEDCNAISEIEKAIVKNMDNPYKLEPVYTSQEALEVIKIWK